MISAELSMTFPFVLLAGVAGPDESDCPCYQSQGNSARQRSANIGDGGHGRCCWGLLASSFDSVSEHTCCRRKRSTLFLLRIVDQTLHLALPPRTVLRHSVYRLDFQLSLNDLPRLSTGCQWYTPAVKGFAGSFSLNQACAYILLFTIRIGLVGLRAGRC